ncbi:hypothetical protein [Propioniciclava tarda]|uniref:Cell division protein FtsL n=1 Tax=Propioniciclava tarda TaxID=433330 RepID=A0A4V2JT38_PROTD|nr:hypothetical protein [Propioniciclava tarda]TBT94751.1 hypothetical protein ET996_09145 [Propioniciclava tarda]SMO64586.1 hypothetical protein SAMN06266982_11030 [Propioniciclava tarda]
MSVWTVAEAKAEASERRAPLTSVRGGKRAAIPGLPFAMLVVLLLAVGMVGLLALNVYVQNSQMALNRAQRQAAALALEVSNKQAQVYVKSAPGEIAAAAGALGMIPNPNPAYVDLRTGAILGSPKPATGNELPALRVQVPSAPTTVAVTPVRSDVQPWFDLPAAPLAAPAAPAKP